MPAALVLCRLLHDGAALLLFGSSLFVSTMVPARLADTLRCMMARTGVTCVTILAASTLAWLGLQAAQFGDGWGDALRPATLAAVLRETEFGHAWQVQAGLALLLAGTVAAGPGRRPGIVALLSGLLLGGLAVVGHAVMRAGLAAWGLRLGVALHLLAGGFWLGGLVPLVPLLDRVREPVHRAEAVRALRRFSGAGHVAVALVVLTGLADLALIRGVAPPAGLPAYLLVLAGKTVLVAVMAVVALVNRYRLVPAMRWDGMAAAQLRRNTLANLVLGVAVIALAALLGTLEPG